MGRLTSYIYLCMLFYLAPLFFLFKKKENNLVPEYIEAEEWR